MEGNPKDFLGDLEEFSNARQEKDDELPVFSSQFETVQNESLPGFSGNSGMQNTKTGENTIVNEEYDEIDVPLPPPELRTAPPHVRLQNIEDEYLQTEPSKDELVEAKEEIEETCAKKQIFVNVEDFGTLLETIDGAKKHIKRFAEISSSLDSMNEASTKEINRINNIFENIQRKVIMIDNRLFEKGEEW